MKLLKRFGIALLVVLVGIQFIPTRSNLSIEAPSTDFLKTYKVPEDMGQILFTSCYNCHSNNTDYPWYSRVQPIGLLLAHHIKKGKTELNFNEFGSYSVRKQISKLDIMVDQIEKGKMPIRSYTLIHHEARISGENKKKVIEYLNALKDSL
jgi:hypothetical protein